MQAVVSRRYRFSASHRLHSEALSAVENSLLFGKCNNPYGHGHDYVLEVSATGEVDQATGLVVRLAALDNLVKNEVLAIFAHRNLNQDVPEFLRLVPTTENVASVVAKRLCVHWSEYIDSPSAWLSGISIQETERNSFALAIPAPISGRAVEVEESVVLNA